MGCSDLLKHSLNLIWCEWEIRPIFASRFTKSAVL
jgi:hypothetical protein